MDDDFDPWRPSDLVRFLRTYGALADERDGLACPADVRDSLRIGDSAAHAALRRLVALGLVEEIPGAPHRLSDGPLDFPHRLTGEGVKAVLNDRLPDVQ